MKLKETTTNNKIFSMLIQRFYSNNGFNEACCQRWLRYHANAEKNWLFCYERNFSHSTEVAIVVQF